MSLNKNSMKLAKSRVMKPSSKGYMYKALPHLSFSNHCIKGTRKIRAKGLGFFL